MRKINKIENKGVENSFLYYLLVNCIYGVCKGIVIIKRLIVKYTVLPMPFRVFQISISRFWFSNSRFVTYQKRKNFIFSWMVRLFTY